jgi:hypothetical protein
MLPWETATVPDERAGRCCPAKLSGEAVGYARLARNFVRRLKELPPCLADQACKIKHIRAA